MFHRLTREILGEEVTVYWNHRVFRRVHEDIEEYWIGEVYYDEDTHEIMGWTEKSQPWGLNVDEVRQTLHWMLDATEKEVLDEAELLALAEENRANGEESLFNEQRLSMGEVLDSLGLEEEDVDMRLGEGVIDTQAWWETPPPGEKELGF